MKLLAVSILSLGCFVTLSQCKDGAAGGGGSQNESDLALCVMMLKVVDSRTGEAVSGFNGINFQASGTETFSRSSPISRTLSMSVARKEGLIFSSWVAPINGVGGLKIDVE